MVDGREGGLGISARIGGLMTQAQISGREWMDGSCQDLAMLK